MKMFQFLCLHVELCVEKSITSFFLLNFLLFSGIDMKNIISSVEELKTMFVKKNHSDSKEHSNKINSLEPIRSVEALISRYDHLAMDTENDVVSVNSAQSSKGVVVCIFSNFASQCLCAYFVQKI